MYNKEKVRQREEKKNKSIQYNKKKQFWHNSNRRESIIGTIDTTPSAIATLKRLGIEPK